MKYLNFLPLILFVLAIVSYLFIAPVQTLVNGYLYQSPCDYPTGYRIGSIDPRFNLSSDQLRQNINQATGIWAESYGKELFVEDPKAKLAINLVFDERQGLSNQIGSLENNLEEQQKSIKPEIEQYQKDVAAFQSKVTQLNKEISDWNSKGGAPKDEYDKLTQRQKDLKTEGEKLNNRAKNLNQSTTEFNEQVGSLNQTIGTFNNTLISKPEEGLYDPNKNKIDIFFHTNHDELVHTLAHEFGHALSMQHVDGVDSIMYFRSNKDITLSSEDKAELQKVCTKIPVWEIGSLKLSEFLRENLRNGELQTSEGA